MLTRPRKILFLVMLFTAFVINNVQAQTDSEVVSQLQEALPMPYSAPEFTALGQWINSKPLTIESLKGKVVLVDFWAYSCINCVRTLPYLTGWDKKYRDAGLVIIGIHAPEFDFEKNPDNVKAAVAKHGIEYPVALDNHLSTWTNFKNRYWPAHYLINKSGEVVYTHFGEGNYAQTENNIRHLLSIKDKAEIAPEISTIAKGQTAETYLGAARAKNFVAKDEGTDKLELGKKHYNFPDSLPAHSWALRGAWQVEGEKITSNEKGAALRLNFFAKKIFLVMSTATGKPISAAVKLNDKLVKEIIVSQSTLYELLEQNITENGLLEITAGDSGLELYAFTFGI